MELAVDIQEEVEERNSIASSEMSDSEDDSLEDTIEAIDDDQDICVDQSDQNDQDLNSIEIREAESLLNKVGKQLYEFVGDPKEDTDDYNIPKEVNQIDATKIDEQHIESNERHSEDYRDDEFLLNVEDKIGPYKCNKCTKSFTFKNSLTKHEIIHTGKKPFKCATCSKSFNSKFSHKRHVMLHEGWFPYRCNICGRGFSSPSNLTFHEKSHTGERPYECKTCSKSFSLNSLLKRHERIHTSEKPFQCNTCKKCFNLQYNLKKHEKIHT